MHHNKIRFIAEWEKQECILMSLPYSGSDWDYILDEILECYKRIISAMSASDVKVLLLAHDRSVAEELLSDIAHRENLVIVEADYNDTWTRDYGPIAVERMERKRSLDFGFNGWGLKFASDYDNLINLQLRDKYIIEPESYRNERDFVLEGGSVETDGRGTLLTTTRCLCSPNRNGGKSKSELNVILNDRLGVDHVLWLDYGSLAGDDTDSHIDTLARLAPDDTIIFTGCRNVDDEHFEELLKMRAQLTLFRTKGGEPFNLIELPLPDPVYDESGDRLPATYANYLVTDHVIFMPGYGQPANDMLACQTVRIAYPGREVVQINCIPLLKQHGSLHCATMQLHEGYVNGALFLKA
ncbi:MAG: agmatine deiminase family protein [Muribaculaceae bacterium]|nr:agmatine deiminase family protein [Muribaculaceae bacterium]